MANSTKEEITSRGSIPVAWEGGNSLNRGYMTMDAGVKFREFRSSVQEVLRTKLLDLVLPS